MSAGLAHSSLLAEVARVAQEAAAVILEVYCSDFAVAAKSDRSPLTVADERAEALIVPALQALLPGVPVVAEEAVSRGGVPAVGATFWLVDPLDGTREFVARNGEFTVNIALVEDGLPTLGVLQVPARACLYTALADGSAAQGAWREDLAGRHALCSRVREPGAAWVLASSRSHGDEEAMAQWLARQALLGQPAARRAVGSSLKFALLAEGAADVYPRLGRTMEWDTAAGHALLRAAGGEVHTLDGQLLRYGKPGFENPHFVAWGQSSADCGGKLKPGSTSAAGKPARPG